MKFVHVSLCCFSVPLPLFGVEARPAPLTGWDIDAKPGAKPGETMKSSKRVPTVTKKMKSSFPDIKDKDLERIVNDLWDDFDAADDDFPYLNSESIYCDPFSFNPTQQVDKDNLKLMKNKLKTYDVFQKKLKTTPRMSDSANLHEWCCSRKLTNSTVIQRDPVCDCSPKGAKVGRNGGINCCSQYVVLEKGVPVCGGIPPFGANQPFVESEWSLDQMIKLKQSDCMFPHSGLVPEKGTERMNHDQWKKVAARGDDIFKQCGPRKCAPRGGKTTEEADICCAGTSEDSVWNRKDTPKKGTTCGCGHSNSVLSKYTTAIGKDCCSKRFKDTENRVCGCIPHSAEKPPAALPTDCCSGNATEREGKWWCMIPDCTDQGLIVREKGNHCCANKTTGKTTDVGKTCGCVPGGTEEMSEIKRADNCCSRRFQNDGKTCDWIAPEQPILDWFNETECYSGKAHGDDNALCSCIPPFSTVRDPEKIKLHPEYCCSGYIITDESSKHNGRCGCIREGHSLGYGSDESHCCSGKAEGGVCTCVPPGVRYNSDEGMEPTDCCSGLASDQFCLCSPATQGPLFSWNSIWSNFTNPNFFKSFPMRVAKKIKIANSWFGDPMACCMESLVGDSGLQCPCIPDGHLVPTSERAYPNAVCCTKIDQSKPKCKSQQVCGEQ